MDHQPLGVEDPSEVTPADKHRCDKGYALNEYLTTPLAHPNTDQERNFNSAHTRTRSLQIPRHLVGKRRDSVCLRKHLDHARLLESAVKGGTYYFHLLLKEEEEA
ncbi:unnamed protein product [Gadus morhua 'NCC']